MAKYASVEFLDGGFTAFKANVNKIILLKAYSAGDNWTAVNTTNNIAEVSTATGDYGVTGADAAARVMQSTAKTGVNVTANSGASPDLHLAFVDTTNSKIYWVTDISPEQVVTSGNTVNLPQVSYTRNQPT